MALTIDAEERLDLAQRLNRLTPGVPLGTELHSAIVRLSGSCSGVEAVALRYAVAGGLEVYLRRRTACETYAGSWHVPGSFYRSGESLTDVLDRLARDEFQVSTLHPQRLVGSFRWAEDRGWITSAVYLVVLGGTPRAGCWYPTHALPESMVGYHQDVIIPAAVAAFAVGPGTPP